MKLSPGLKARWEDGFGLKHGTIESRYEDQNENREAPQPGSFPLRPESKVYILGAGCSRHCGYPLGPEMRKDLESFEQKLDPATSPRLRKAVADTIALMAGTVDTIDTLVQKLNNGQLDRQIGAENVDPFIRSRLRRQRVKDATIAISAAFISREKEVRELGFKRYRDFLHQLFPGAETNWLAIKRSNVPHVLTFNYDQAFEIAFLDRFRNTNQFSLYGRRVLNSGLNLNGIGFEAESFSFLKLHGSVGIWVADFPGDPMYRQEEPKDREAATIGDGLFFADPPATPGITYAQREPILFFPSERQFVISNESGFLFHNYARAVWDRATQLISNATEIHVIGYSFSGIDRGPILDMLDRARDCQRLVIQSPDADQICNRLKLDRRQLRDLIECASLAF